MAMKFLVLFMALIFATKHNTEGKEEIFEQNTKAPILVKIEEDEYDKAKKTENSSEYIGVSYVEAKKVWHVQRWSKNKKKLTYNGDYKAEEIAAHASDTLARKLLANGEQNHKLNFPDDETEVHLEKKINTSKFKGVSYDGKNKLWQARRYSKNEKKNVHNGTYKSEKTAAHASDTLARELMANGEQNHKLNFSDNDTEVHREKKEPTSIFIGVSYEEKKSMWQAQRWSKNEKKMIKNGNHKNEETAAHASDTLAKQLMENGEQNHKLNFPNDNAEVDTEKRRKTKRKRSDDFKASPEQVSASRFEKET